MRIVAGFEVGKRASSSGFPVLILLLLFGGFFGHVRAHAQTASQAAEIVKSLGQSSHTVLDRLTELNRLSADEWRFHAGDLAHGESTELDDSSWQVVKAQAQGSEEAEWFRRSIEVPQSLHGYDLTGARIWFRVSA